MQPISCVYATANMGSPLFVEIVSTDACSVSIRVQCDGEVSLGTRASLINDPGGG